MFADLATWRSLDLLWNFGVRDESRTSAVVCIMRAIMLKTRRLLLTGIWKRPDATWPCLLHDHAVRNCATCEALIGSMLR